MEGGISLVSLHLIQLRVSRLDNIPCIEVANMKWKVKLKGVERNERKAHAKGGSDENSSLRV